MPFNGGLNPSPERSGGGRPTIGRVLDSLVAQLGSAYDGSSNTTVWAYATAYARAIAELYSTNLRLSHQWDPVRMTDFLPRWETILKIYPPVGSTLVSRRAAVAAAFARIGKPPTYQAVIDQLTTVLSPIPFRIVHGSSATANVWTPVGWPMGTHPTGSTFTPAMAPYVQPLPDWYSTVAEITIIVSKPAGIGDGDFYTRLGAIHTVLDPLLPAWATWQWIRQDIHPGAGFFLDEPNVDQEGFRL